MRQRACTDLCGGWSAMIVPTATKWFLFPKTGLRRDCDFAVRVSEAGRSAFALILEAPQI
jgi:hypothetical protein